ncbi:MAG TPA: nuclear transport factor 2 family protein [Candidatus Acidoferrum sp.]|nr:nuclear transport factor 2 family protein [Candidatus Acidoferrum sp.]
MAAKPVPAATSGVRVLFALIVCAALFVSMTCPALAQKDKKKKKDAAADAATHTTIPMPDEQQIDYNISEMLGSWQVGDVERLHKAYSDDAVFVSGQWVPPVFGWSSFLPLFQQQRARMQQVRMDRVNTFIKVAGSFGWACYQWDFSGTVDGQSMAARGQTTLIFEKRGDRWLIVHNHTSVAQPAPPATQPQNSPANTATPQPSKPPAS